MADEIAEKITMRTAFPAHQISKLPKNTISAEEYKKLPKSKCVTCGGFHPAQFTIHLDYVGHAALTDRLLDVDPSWTWEPLATKDGLPAFDVSGGLWIKLTVAGITRPGYGNAKINSYADVGSREKEVIGDALRNAAMRFGAALDLWHKGDLHLEGEPVTPPPPPPPVPENFNTEISKLNECRSIHALSLAWNKLDKRTQHALESIKNGCKDAIIKAGKEAEDILQ